MTTDWPVWWQWDIVLSNRLLDQLDGLGLTDVDVRTMLELADAYREARVEGRYVVEAEHRGDEWDVTIEPDQTRGVITVVKLSAVDWNAEAA
ncbi:MAG: hypothetical protein AAF586_10440 [Planctomycetota bacterium]